MLYVKFLKKMFSSKPWFQEGNQFFHDCMYAPVNITPPPPPLAESNGVFDQY